MVASIPYAEGVLVLDAEPFEAIRRAVRLLHGVAHGEPFAARVDPGADEVARHRPGNEGIFMGYDFHVGPDGPRLIEVNTNAGGAVLNGLRTAAVVDPERLGCLCRDLLPAEDVEERIADAFRRELARARGPGARLGRVAIVDDRPQEQLLYAEFERVRELLERRGIAAAVADTRALAPGASGGVTLAGAPVDLVYLRDTDFLLAGERTRALRRAYLADEVVVTPAPREHHLLANKARLALFSSETELRALAVAPDDAAFLALTVPETRLLESLGGEAAWRTRREWVFKPAAAHASRGVYRGDKISRRKLEEILAAGGYVAQRRVPPAELEVRTDAGPRRMKFDVRAYAYGPDVLLLGARVYQGQVTNFRTPGGGFSAICVAREPAGCSTRDGTRASR